MIDLIYQDQAIVVCVKPFRVLSTDEPGGVPELVRKFGRPSASPRPRSGQSTGWTRWWAG